MYLPKETNIAFIFIELAVYVATDLTFPLLHAFYNITILRLSTAVSKVADFLLPFFV